jgi:hypothetical protein
MKKFIALFLIGSLFILVGCFLFITSKAVMLGKTLLVLGTLIEFSCLFIFLLQKGFKQKT